MPTDDPCPMPTVNTGKPEISMAPLVDIVFLLLIFFMVTTVFPENDGLLIEKPDSENAAALDNEHVIIKLDRQGIAYMEEQPVTTDDIERLLEIELAKKPQLAVTIHADRRATTESLIDVIDAAKAGGARQLGIATDEKHD
ncbi:MAG TPA: biopolymer transporter ExbD [Gammaproteobacteria bacterium]|nr:biopolymer transporter ExbD [Gammaproteobacteria bacterium]